MFSAKMKFIDDQAVVDNDHELLSDTENEDDEFDDLIDNSSLQEEGVSFYREVDSRPFQFHNETRNSHAINELQDNL